MVIEQLSEQDSVLLSIIIVNWNTEELLAGCLRSVYETVYDSRLEVFVVDNASTDGSTEMVREQFPQVLLVENSENVGFARANNQAIRRCRGCFVLLLNSDTEVYPGALEAMLRFMEEHPQSGGCGPRLLNPDGSLQASCHPMLTTTREFWRLMFLDRFWPRATYAQERWSLDRARPVEVLKGACFLLRRAALDQVGLLDEQYFMYTEEMDLCYRLLQAGWQLWWVPQATVKHYGEASSTQVAESMYVQLYRSKVQFHRKFGGAVRASQFKRLLRIAYAPRLAYAAVGGLFSERLAVRSRAFSRLWRELPDM